MAKVVATGRGKARRKRELAHCINVICVTIVVLAVTFSTFITVLYFQKSRDCSVLRQKYVQARFNLDRVMETMDKVRTHVLPHSKNRTSHTAPIKQKNEKTRSAPRPEAGKTAMGLDSLGKKSDVLVLTILNDFQSFGKKRTINDYIELLKRFEYDPKKISVGMLVTDIRTYEAVERVWRTEHSNHFDSVKVFHRELDGDLSRRIGRSDGLRHMPSIQKARRSLLARYRNTLLSLTLGNLGMYVEHVLWIDADMQFIPPTIIQQFKKTKKKIVTLHTKRNLETYDLNAWKGPRTHPNPSELRRIKEGGLFVPRPAPGLKHIDQFDLSEKKAEYLVPLDSVGGTVLWVDAKVHRQGINFPPYYAIGTEWDRPGWDGIETEGLCYIADQVYGGKNCFGLPNVVAFHHAS